MTSEVSAGLGLVPLVCSRAPGLTVIDDQRGAGGAVCFKCDGPCAMLELSAVGPLGVRLSGEELVH